MSRSTKKGPYVDANLMRRVDTLAQGKQKAVIKTWSRASLVVPQMIGLTIGVHDGRRHVPIFVTENMVGHRLGEFAPTRSSPRHSAKAEKVTSITRAAPAAAAPAAEKKETTS